MTPKKLDWEERKEVRGQILEASYDPIRQYGTTHTSVEKVMAAAGLDESALYNFFPSEEHLVYEMMGCLHTQLMDYSQQLLNGREKLSIPQVKEFLKKIIFSERSIHQCLTVEDEKKLCAVLPSECFFDTQHESQVMMQLLRRMEGVRVGLDEHLVTNLPEVMVLVQISQAWLYADALEHTL